MENINWEFLVQIGILVCLVILVYRSFRVEDSMLGLGYEVHENQRKHSEYLANVPTYAMLYSLKKDEPYYDK